MAIIAKVLEKHSLLEGSKLKLGFPDENGTPVEIAIAPTELDQLLEGQTYDLDFKFHTVNAHSAIAPDPMPAGIVNPPAAAITDTITPAAATNGANQATLATAQ